jgi:hypothetical protein
MDDYLIPPICHIRLLCSSESRVGVTKIGGAVDDMGTLPELAWLGGMDNDLTRKYDGSGMGLLLMEALET